MKLNIEFNNNRSVIKPFKRRKENNESEKYCASMLLDILDYFENRNERPFATKIRIFYHKISNHLQGEIKNHNVICVLEDINRYTGKARECTPHRYKNIISGCNEDR